MESLLDQVDEPISPSIKRAFYEGVHYFNTYLKRDSSTNLENLVHTLALSGEPLEFLSHLLTLEVDLSWVDGTGNSALISAAANANDAACRELIHYSSPDHLNIQCVKGNSALHLLAGKGYEKVSADGQQLKISNLELMRAIVAKGGNLNLQNEDGNTALHFACAHHDLLMIQLLLQNGALWDLPNRKEQTPLDMLRFDTAEVKDLLENTVLVYLLKNHESTPMAPMLVNGHLYIYHPSNNSVYFSMRLPCKASP